MAEALQRVEAESAAATPDSTTQAAAPAAPATEAPAAPPPNPFQPESPAPAEPAKGPIPYERHKAALDNARRKGAEDAQAQFVSRFRPQLDVIQALTTNPNEAIPQLYREWRESQGLPPEMSPTDAARMLASRRGQAPPTTEPGPDIVGTDAAGQQVPMYSAEQQAKREAWFRGQMLAEFKQELAPLQQEHAQTQAARAQEQRVAQVKGVIAPVLESYRAKPGFKEHETAIKAAQAELVKEGMHPFAALGLAYAEIVPPRLQSQTQATTQQSFLTAAAAKVAGSQNNPGQVAPSPPRRPRSAAEALQQVFAASEGRG